jgi:hypothetical protein
MSTILKALRRLEQEKTRTDRPLREQVTGLAGLDRDDAGGSRRWPILLGGIGAGIFAGLAVLLLVLLRGDSPAPPPAAEPAPLALESPQQASPQPTRRRASPPPIPSALPAPAAAPAAPPVPVASDDVEMLERAAPAPRVVAEVAKEEPASAPAEPPPGSVRPFEHAARRAPPVVTPPAEAPVARTEPIAAPAPATPLPAPATRLPAPPVAKPAKTEPAPAEPEAARAPVPKPPPPDPFPALRVERTTWHPLAERRLAVIDVPGQGTRELREGDQVAGATVASIEPSGVVFRFEGRDVRRKIGGGS